MPEVTEGEGPGLILLQCFVTCYNLLELCISCNKRTFRGKCAVIDVINVHYIHYVD